jgi:hypothetical protein
MKTKKPIWRKIKGNWVNITELSNKKDNIRFIPVDEHTMTYKVRGNTARPSDARRYFWCKTYKKWNVIEKINNKNKKK